MAKFLSFSRVRKLPYALGLRSFRSPQLLWSKGVGDFCDFAGPRWYRHAQTERTQPESFFTQHYQGAHGLVWLRLGTVARENRICDLDTFVKVALPTISKPFLLVTTDGDVSVPSELRAETVEALTAHPFLVSWFSQNCDGSHPKVRPFPIGIDLHTLRDYTTPSQLVRLLQGLGASAAPVEKRPLKVFCDLNLSLSKERRKAVDALRGCGHVEFAVSRVSQGAIWKRYVRYPLVLSASGNGLDCHRTWELLYLGCIVVTKASPLDPLYEGLPVIIVDDWPQVRDVDMLQQCIREFSPLTDHDYIRKRLRPEAYFEPLRNMLSQNGGGVGI